MRDFIFEIKEWKEKNKRLKSQNLALRYVTAMSVLTSLAMGTVILWDYIGQL